MLFIFYCIFCDLKVSLFEVASVIFICILKYFDLEHHCRDINCWNAHDHDWSWKHTFAIKCPSAVSPMEVNREELWIYMVYSCSSCHVEEFYVFFFVKKKLFNFVGSHTSLAVIYSALKVSDEGKSKKSAPFAWNV